MDRSVKGEDPWPGYRFGIRNGIHFAYRLIAYRLLHRYLIFFILLKYESFYIMKVLRKNTVHVTIILCMERIVIILQYSIIYT